jgi:hypothetical protein
MTKLSGETELPDPEFTEIKLDFIGINPQMSQIEQIGKKLKEKSAQSVDWP